MAGIDPDMLRALFVQEAEGRLAELGRLLLQLEQAGEDPDLVGAIFREMHTLKGSSAVAGLEEVTGIAHRLEDLVDELRSDQRPVTPEVIDTLLRGVDQLGAALSAPAGSPPPRKPARVDRTHTSVRPTPAPAGPAADPPAPAIDGGGVIMVPVERLEELTRLVGESASAHLRIGRMLEDRFSIDPATCPEFNELSRSLTDLQDRAMRTQMVPVSTVTDQLQRAVRDLARTHGKDVRWETEGMTTELDRGVLRQLSDSLMHLVRNAVDHGIESPDGREAAGKPRQATLRLHAMQLGSEVIIAVADDGRGIDVDDVSRQARENGVDTDGLTDDELLELTFAPGLSTAKFVTDVSGRGVGLDAVRASVEAAHGRVEVRSTPGEGTEFRIVVPITVAVLRCLLVEAGGQNFALPFHRVLLSQAHAPAKLTHNEGRPVVWVDDQPVPVQGLAETVGMVSEVTTGPVVVLADATRGHAFAVDRLIGQRDVVIKALNPLLPHLRSVAGASVEPDGSVLLVLDPPGLIQRARHATRRNGFAAPPEHHPTIAHRHSVLVVDDALTIRELQRNILERAGFDVRVATDGTQALSSLAQAPADLVLTDIEMPNMNGFELTEAIRARPALANIPVLILSSRSSDVDRQRGLDVGADGYITKSGFDESSLLTAVNRLLGSHP
ncbi:MAG TPA: response regulator [Mycobacteriales bacterium]|jgi:two-component system chemotaxis sensor kinase CheA